MKRLAMARPSLCFMTCPGKWGIAETGYYKNVYFTMQQVLICNLSLLDATNVAASKHSSAAHKWSVRNMAAVVMLLVGGVALVAAVVIKFR